HVDPDELAAWLVDHGFRRTEAVELPAEFSRRGGIVDVFSADADAPYRLEFFGDEIESIRQFSPHTQPSLPDLQSIKLLGTTAEQASVSQDGRRRESSPVTYPGHLCDYLAADAWTVLIEPDDLHEQGKHYLERVADPRGLFSVPAVFQQLLRFPNVQQSALPAPSVEATCHLRLESVERFSGDVTKVPD